MFVRSGASICVAAALLLAVSCGNSKSGNGNPVQSNKPGYTLTESYPYTSAGDSIVATVNRNMCDSTVLKHIATMTLKYVISGETLSVWYASSTGDALSQDQSSGILVYLRQGSGSGLVGEWTLLGGKDSLSSPVDTTGAGYSTSEVTEFTGTTMDSYSKGTPAQNAYETYKALFASMPEYEITVTQPSDLTVQLHGTASGETVSITYAADYSSMTFSSSVQGNASHTYYTNPSTCPDDVMPTWFTSFLAANFTLTTSKRLAAGTFMLPWNAVANPVRMLLRR